jgi:hypothetical protein
LNKTLALGFNPFNHVVRACSGAGSDIFRTRHDGGISWSTYLAGLEKCRLLGEPANRFAASHFLINFRADEVRTGWCDLICSALNFSQLAADTR